MALDTSILRSDRETIIADLPITVTIGGNPYTGRKSLNKTEIKYAENGQVAEYDFSVSLMTDDVFSTGTKATIDAIEYRIVSVDIGSVPGFRTLHLINEYQ